MIFTTLPAYSSQATGALPTASCIHPVRRERQDAWAPGRRWNGSA